MGREGDIDNGERNLVESGKKKRLGQKGARRATVSQRFNNPVWKGLFFHFFLFSTILIC